MVRLGVLAVLLVQEANHFIGCWGFLFRQGGVQFGGAAIRRLGAALQAGSHEAVLVLKACDLQRTEVTKAKCTVLKGV